LFYYLYHVLFVEVVSKGPPKGDTSHKAG